jgi:hypothetical protein
MRLYFVSGGEQILDNEHALLEVDLQQPATCPCGGISVEGDILDAHVDRVRARLGEILQT